jgi:hypothetical protein
MVKNQKTTKESEIKEENKPIIIAKSRKINTCKKCGNMEEFDVIQNYVFSILLRAQNNNRVILHARPFHVANAEHLAQLFTSLGMERIGSNKPTKTKNEKTGEEIDVIEIVLDKIPAIKK